MENGLMELIMHRRAIRRFDTRQIDEDVLRQILDAGLYAPSAGGRQSAIFAVCQDREVNKRLGKIKRANSSPRMAKGGNYISKEQQSIADDPKLTDAFYGAPTVLVVLASKDRPTCVEDGSLVMGNLMNAAHALGVGSCWIHRAREVFDSEEGKALLQKWGIKGDYIGVGHCILGYPADGAVPEAKPRKDDYIVYVR